MAKSGLEVMVSLDLSFSLSNMVLVINTNE
jgi:hypothetical protein